MQDSDIDYTSQIMQHIRDRWDDLFDEIELLLAWVFDFEEKHQVPLGEAIDHHVRRILAILSEVEHPPSQKLLELMRQAAPAPNNLPNDLLQQENLGSPNADVTLPYVW